MGNLAQGALLGKTVSMKLQQMPLIKSSTKNVKEIRIRFCDEKKSETSLDRVQGFDIIIVF